MYKGLFLHVLTNTYLVFLTMVITGGRCYLLVVLIFVTLVIDEIEQHFSTCWLFVCLILKNVYSLYLPIFLKGLFLICLLSCMKNNNNKTNLFSHVLLFAAP